MDFHPNVDQQASLDRAQQLLQSEFSTALVREAEASDDGFPRALWEEGVELGWSGLLIAEDCGGSGHDLLDMCLLLEQIGRAGATLPLVVSSGVAATMLQRSPDSERRNELLRTIARGGIVAPALVDAQGRNEWDAPSVALLTEGSDHRLTGTKVLVPFACVADALLVTVAGPDGDTVIVAVAADATGITITPHRSKVGVPLASVDFHEVVVPSNGVIHAGPAAREALDAGLHVGSMLATAEAVGWSEALIALTAEYVSNREAFGRPIGTFQAVAHPCAEMRISTDVVRMLVQQAAWLIDAGQAAAEEVPAAKALANELFDRVANDAYRLHGALGFSNECDVQLFMRRMQGFFGSFGETQESFERAGAALGM